MEILGVDGGKEEGDILVIVGLRDVVLGFCDGERGRVN